MEANVNVAFLEANVALLEDDLKPDTKAQVWEVCQKINWKNGKQVISLLEKKI